MPNRITVSISIDPTYPPESSDGEAVEAYDEDTAVGKVGETTTTSENLRIGLQDVMKGLEKIFGNELHGSKVVKRG